MRFYVIYSFDATKDYDISDFVPDDSWEQTEGDEQWEYDYLADESPNNAHIWRDGQHRKFVHENLSKEDFLDFIHKIGLRYEDIETLGSLTGIGWLPALSFHNTDDTMNMWDTEGFIDDMWDTEGFIDITAYVTPFPEPVRPMFSVQHRPNQIAIWPLTDDELLAYGRKRQMNDWNLIRSAFSGGS